jgi:flavin reductase (DIM6/NTAB) family NADH-FMN oxidoreductase RutF
MTAHELDDGVFRKVMARFATGVTVMTALDDRGEPTGMTANAVTSVSLDPLLVLACVGRDTDMAARVTVGGRFALSFLPAGAEDLSAHFADPNRSRGWPAFRDVEVRTATTGCPIIASAIGWVDCTVADVHPGGDHLIVVGSVVAAGFDDQGGGEALGYFRHGYVTIPPPGA